MLGGHLSYRTYLKAELENRCRRDPKYSLRTFAKALNISSTSLSDLLRGQTRLSVSRAAQLGQKLGLPENHIATFCDMVQSEDEKCQVLRKIAQSRLANPKPKYTDLDNLIFQVVSDWQHYAILELMNTRSFRSDPRWIARKLGVSNIAVENSIERLKKVGLIVEKGNKLVRTLVKLQTKPDQSSSGVRKHQEQLIEKSIKALQTQPISKRNFTSMMLALDPSLLPQAKIKINRFIEELTDFLESGDSVELYTFNTQLFSLDMNPKEDQ